MTIRMILTALSLAVVPMASLAGPGCQGRDHQAQSCESGFVWDSVAQGCVKQVTG